MAYVYYPYMLAPHELSFVVICNDLLHNESDILPYKHQEAINGAFKPSPPGSYDDTVLEAKRQNRLAGCLEDIKIMRLKTDKRLLHKA